MMDQVEAFCLKQSFNSEVELPAEFKSKEFFKCFLAFICENKALEPENQVRIIEVLRNELITMGLKYTEVIDEWAIANVVLYQRMTSSNIIENDFEHFVKLITFVCIISRNLHQSNQILSNLITIINCTLTYLLQQSHSSQHLRCLLLIELNIKLAIAIKAFNPSIIPQMARMVRSIAICNEFDISDADKKKFLYAVKGKGSLEALLKRKACELTGVLLETYKEDINIDILFSKLMLEMPKLIGKDRHVKASVESLEVLYQSHASKAKSKKQLRMNYLLIKPKPLSSLEPDYDLSFLGDNPEFLNQKEKKKEMERIMKKKVKEKEKQVIRKLKHESKIIDIERQKELAFIDKKKKEDQRLTNQFMEEQNIECKKLMTSNAKKRFKFKRKKGSQ